MDSHPALDATEQSWRCPGEWSAGNATDRGRWGGENHRIANDCRGFWRIPSASSPRAAGSIAAWRVRGSRSAWPVVDAASGRDAFASARIAPARIRAAGCPARDSPAKTCLGLRQAVSRFGTARMDGIGRRIRKAGKTEAGAKVPSATFESRLKLQDETGQFTNAKSQRGGAS